ncbi:MAG: hypothetical protein V1922_05995 [bacterium]
MKKNFLLFVMLVVFVVFFRGAFSTSFFSDDFKFLALGKQLDIFSFLSPLRTTFYRPLPTEFFYFILQRLPLPTITGHIIVFIVFLLGVLFLYKTLLVLINNREISLFSCILYLFHFSHVYQLYWFATFQEVAQFALLISSLYFILKKRFVISIFLFLLALLSKEQALLFPLVAFFFYFVKYKKIHPLFVIYIILDCIFIGIHLFVNSRMPILPEYIIHLSPKLFVNNALWYGLWSLGFPAMMSDYMRSIFSLPFGAFWNYFTQPTFCIYFFGMATYSVLFIFFSFSIFIKNRKERSLIATYVICGIVLFVFFLLPVLPIIHKWMVRLTIPLIFISVIEGFILAFLWKKKRTKPFVVLLIILYLVWNYFGIKQHEIISTYTRESSITKQAGIIFSNKKRFENCKVLYIEDPKNMKISSWEGSEKLALTLSGDSFLSYYFPERSDLKVVYEYKSKTPSEKNCSINANELIK